jgi:hypothetical protein
MPIDDLLHALNEIPAGELGSDVRDQVVHLLRSCWQDFAGWDETSIYATPEA